MSAIEAAEAFRPSTQVQESSIIAGEVRARVARRGISMREFARDTGLDHMWLSRRVGGKASVQMTIEDVAVIARALDVEVAQLLEPLCAIRDSNPEPADLKPPRWRVVAGGDGSAAMARTPKAAPAHGRRRGHLQVVAS